MFVTPVRDYVCVDMLSMCGVDMRMWVWVCCIEFVGVDMLTLLRVCGCAYVGVRESRVRTSALVHHEVRTRVGGSDSNKCACRHG